MQITLHLKHIWQLSISSLARPVNAAKHGEGDRDKLLFSWAERVKQSDSDTGQLVFKVATLDNRYFIRNQWEQHPSQAKSSKAMQVTASSCLIVYIIYDDSL